MEQRTTIETLRGRIAALQQERRTLEGQPRSRKEVAEYVRRTVARWKEGAQRDLELSLNAIASGNRAEMLNADIVPVQYGNREALLGPVLALVMGENLTKLLLQHVNSTVPEGTESALREARIEEIGQELDALEAQEEALICEAEEAGELILRRADARPEIVLGTHDPVVIQKQGSGALVSENVSKAPRFSQFVPNSRP